MKNLLWRVVFFALLIFAQFAFAQDQEFKGQTLKLRNTYYYVLLESLYAKEAKDTTILSMKGELIAQVSHRFKKALNMEGTGRLVDGRVVNYAGRVNGEIRYLVSSAPDGYGVGTCRLYPWHSVAVDPKVVALGSVVYIAETEGMLLPNGEIHDGIWRAEDVGGGIVGDRVDLFVGDGDRGDVLEKAGITNLKALHVTIVEEPKAHSCVDEHFSLYP